MITTSQQDHERSCELHGHHYTKCVIWTPIRKITIGQALWETRSTMSRLQWVHWIFTYPYSQCCISVRQASSWMVE